MEKIISILQNKEGIEIGGPTELFSNKGKLPLYKFLKQLDNINMMENAYFPNIQKNKFNIIDNKNLGNQFDIHEWSNKKYDYLISSHVIEHLANPIKELNKWMELINDGGYILSIIPHKSKCWDKTRPVTSFEHILEDYQNNVSEDDMTHLDEVLQTDHPTKKQLGNAKFKELCLDNKETRIMHHHCFDVNLVQQLFDYLKVQTIICVQHPKQKLQIIHLGKIVRK